MKNTVLAPVIGLLVLLAVAWAGLFGLSQVKSTTDERPSTARAATPTTTPWLGAQNRSTSGAATPTVPPSAARPSTTAVPTTDARSTTSGSRGAPSTDRSSTAGRPAATERPLTTERASAGHRPSTTEQPVTTDRRPATEQQSAADARPRTDAGAVEVSHVAGTEARQTEPAASNEGLSNRGAALLILVLLLVFAGNQRRH